MKPHTTLDESFNNFLIGKVSENFEYEILVFLSALRLPMPLSGTYGLFKEKLSAFAGFLTSVSRRLLGKISHIMNSVLAKGLNFFNITGIIFTLIDFALMVLYLTQYLALI